MVCLDHSPRASTALRRLARRRFSSPPSSSSSPFTATHPSEQVFLGGFPLDASLTLPLPSKPSSPIVPTHSALAFPALVHHVRRCEETLSPPTTSSPSPGRKQRVPSKQRRRYPVPRTTETDLYIPSSTPTKPVPLPSDHRVAWLSNVFQRNTNSQLALARYQIADPFKTFQPLQSRPFLSL